MKKTIYYTLDNIQKLLSQEYPFFQWNYEISDRQTGNKREVKIEDFTNSLFYTVSLPVYYKNDEYSLDVAVSDFEFIIYEDEPNIMGSGSTYRVKDDFSNNWINLLLDEHKENYAKVLLTYSEKILKQIEDKAKEEISVFSKKIQEKANRNSLPFKNFSKLAKQYLPQEDISETEKI